MRTRAEQRGVPRGNSPASSMVRRLKDLTRTNPPIYTRYKTTEDPQEFVDEIHKILCVIGLTYVEKSKIASYQLKDVAPSWYKLW